MRKVEAEVDPDDAATIRSVAEVAMAVDGLAKVSAATAAVAMSADDVAMLIL